jgi:pimeloyl-ACP methyl ester carboxylesterase
MANHRMIMRWRTRRRAPMLKDCPAVSRHSAARAQRVPMDHMPVAHTRLVMLLAVANPVLVAPVVAQTGPGGGYTPRFEEADCRFELPAEASEGVACGYVTVPENWEDPDGRSLGIPVAVFRATAPDPRPEPILFLRGGPSPSLQAAGGAAGSLLRRDRDLVIADYRGVGFAGPLCPGLGPAYLAALTQARPAAALDETVAHVAADCRRWSEEQGIDLRQYHARNMARDALAVMDALGYTSWNVYAISFGTAVAQHMMRLRPEAIRAAAMLGPVALDAERVEGNAFAAALDRMAEYCAADPACADTYPAPRADFEALYEQLEREPLRVPISPGPLFPDGEMHLTGTGLQRLVLGMFYQRAGLAAVPMLVRETARGNPAPVAVAARRLAEEAAALSGANWAAHCDLLGEWGGAGASPAARRADDDYLRGALPSRCAALGVPPAPQEARRPVEIGVPALVVVGEHDPVTPPAFAEAVARSHPRSTVLELRGQGHEFPARCAFPLALAFFDDPVGIPDASCFEALPPVPFIGAAGGP